MDLHEILSGEAYKTPAPETFLEPSLNLRRGEVVHPRCLRDGSVSLNQVQDETRFSLDSPAFYVRVDGILLLLRQQDPVPFSAQYDVEIWRGSIKT